MVLTAPSPPPFFPPPADSTSVIDRRSPNAARRYVAVIQPAVPPPTITTFFSICSPSFRAAATTVGRANRYQLSQVRDRVGPRGVPPSRASAKHRRDPAHALHDVSGRRRVRQSEVTRAAAAERASGQTGDAALVEEPVRQRPVVHARAPDVRERVERALRPVAADAGDLGQKVHHPPPALPERLAHPVHRGGRPGR